ncbi:MAG: hypothetical protein ACI8TP_005076 [Acidimicrobiales bacterium]|jgi:hypothetical protein
MNWRPRASLVVVFLVFAGSCGGDSDTSTEADTTSALSVVSDLGENDQAADGQETDGGDAADLAEDLAESLTDQQAAQGGGGAVLVVGDDEWTFDSVLCAFGEDQIGQEGAEFVLSSIQDGLQMYATIDSFGHSVSLNDIEDFEDPSVDLGSTGDGFIIVNGKDINAEADFRDGTSDGFETVTGTFTATCP